ncbi:MAG TPA: tetratricopeptide repeat protein [Gemmatimonadales bacterium]|nr:tetratricopeptide repeat protein [Gemmatimonadales bacterium]
MAYTSEIEKLEKRWAENPKGRNFAPLADAYRKAGELDRAIELCTAGLERHPDYVSAHIVFGRCLIDQKNDPGASEVFRKVLALDPENVLALKILAEIAERGGRYDEAADWLSRLLSADPMNGDAAEALARAKGRAAQSTPTPDPVARLVPEAARPPKPNRDLVIEHASEEPTSPRLDVKGTPADIETFDGTLDFNAVAHSAAKADGIEVQEEVVLKPQELVVEGLAHTQFESGIFAMPPDTAESEDEPTIDLPLIMPDEVLEDAPAAPPPPPTPPSPATPAPAAQRAPAVAGAAGSVGAQPPAAVALSDDDGAADTAALSRAEPMLTETMAELYLRQGHPEEALRVYEALLAKRPRDARLRGRVQALAGGGAREVGRGTGETVQIFLKRILAGRPGAPAHSAPAARSPLEDAFAIAHSDAEPSSTPDVVSPGEATRPATDSLSLDQVFGDEGSRSSGAAPEAAPPAPSPAPQDTGGFSFDQFFSPSEQAAGGGEVAPATPEPPARSSGGRLRPPVEDEGDLDQFQAWLRGLKS